MCVFSWWTNCMSIKQGWAWPWRSPCKCIQVCDQVSDCCAWVSDQVSGFCSALLVSEDGKLANTICEQQQHLYSELYHNILCSVGLKGLYYCDNTRVSDWHCDELEDSRHLMLFGKGYMARPWSQMISKCTQVCDQVSDCCVSEDGNMVQPWICRHSSGMIYSR